MYVSAVCVALLAAMASADSDKSHKDIPALPARSPDVANPHVRLDCSGPVEAGKTYDIKWDGQGKYGYVNIDLKNTCGLMTHVDTIATVPASQGAYSWSVPDYLKSGSCYQVRVWGVEQPRQGETQGQSNTFNVQNSIPNAPNHFIVKRPDQVAVDRECKVEWNYSPVAVCPAMVDINLCKEGHGVVRKLATVPASDKQFVWNVPAELCDGGKYYLQVAGGPICDNGDLGANTTEFVFVEPAVVEAEANKAVATVDYLGDSYPIVVSTHSWSLKDKPRIAVDGARLYVVTSDGIKGISHALANLTDKRHCIEELGVPECSRYWRLVSSHDGRYVSFQCDYKTFRWGTKWITQGSKSGNEGFEPIAFGGDYCLLCELLSRDGQTLFLWN
jgi:hypothetical protein